MLKLSEYLASDHDRLDGLLRRSTSDAGAIDMGSYDAFRGGLLRHIAMEERSVFPAVLRLPGAGQAAILERLRLDHGALAALLVPPPNPAILATLQSILSVHNALEEKDDGVYRLLDRLPEAEKAVLLETLKATPRVPLAPYNEKPGVIDATRRAVARAGYHLRD